jgi:hypothetical protein
MAMQGVLPRWLPGWRELRSDAMSAFSRFPAAVLALAGFAIYLNLDIAEITTVDEPELARAGLALVSGALIAAAAVLFGERQGMLPALRHALSIVLGGVLALAIWYWEPLAVAFPALFIAAALSLPLGPYLRSGTSGFWTFLWGLAHAGALAAIAMVLFCLGVSAILATIDYLFGVAMDDSVYAHVWSLGLGFVAPLFALSLIPTAPPEADAPDHGNILVTGLRTISDFVAAPLLAIYVVILHLYALKILIEAELPKGQIGWMVLSFGLAVLALRIVTAPMYGIGRAPTRLFLRWWAIGLVVPLVLLVVAIAERIGAYGVTPERYALALFAVFLGAVLLAQFHPRLRSDIRVIPALGALALLLSSFGPWGMIPVAARSQTDRLMAHLSEAGALQDGLLVSTPDFSATAAQDVRSIVDMLYEIGQIDRLRPIFAAFSAAPFAPRSPDETFADTVRRTLDVETVPAFAGDFFIEGRAGAVAIDDYDLVVPDLVLAGGPSVTVPLGDTTLAIRPGSLSIDLEAGGKKVQITPALLREAFETRIATVETLPGSERPSFLVELALGSREIALLFTQVSGRLDETEFSLTGGTFDLFLRRSDWTGGSGGDPAGSSEP